jgi:hypothetical protein
VRPPKNSLPPVEIPTCTGAAMVADDLFCVCVVGKNAKKKKRRNYFGYWTSSVVQEVFKFKIQNLTKMHLRERVILAFGRPSISVPRDS